jgi:uncharacterized protein YlxW (UPF0749 family)
MKGGDSVTTEVVTAIGTIVGAIASALVAKYHYGNNEPVYAKNTADLFARIDKLTDERDQLQEQVVELKAKVDKQTLLIESLTAQVQHVSKVVGVVGVVADTQKEENN